MTRRLAPVLGAFVMLGLLGCESEPEATAATEPEASAASPEIDPALLRELLGESVRVSGNDVRADGMLIRLAFDPLIRQTGPVSLQLVQGQGYRLSGVAESSPLWLLGLRDGDVLTGVDKQAIIGREHELRSLYDSRPRSVQLAFMRGSEGHTIDLDIASGSAWRSSVEVRERPERPERPSSSPAAAFDPEAMLAFARGLRCVVADSPPVVGHCEVARTALDTLLGSPGSLSRQARIVPALREDETHGFKLYAIRPDSLPYLLGFKNGDLLTRINGQPLTSLDEAMEVYSSLRSETEFRVEFERKSSSLTLEVQVVDALSGPAASMPRTSSTRSDGEASPSLRGLLGGR